MWSGVGCAFGVGAVRCVSVCIACASGCVCVSKRRCAGVSSLRAGTPLSGRKRRPFCVCLVLMRHAEGASPKGLPSPGRQSCLCLSHLASQLLAPLPSPAPCLALPSAHSRLLRSHPWPPVRASQPWSTCAAGYWSCTPSHALLISRAAAGCGSRTVSHVLSRPRTRCRLWELPQGRAWIPEEFQAAQEAAAAEEARQVWGRSRGKGALLQSTCVSCTE